jgi:hypothetical protein
MWPDSRGSSRYFFEILMKIQSRSEYSAEDAPPSILSSGSSSTMSIMPTSKSQSSLLPFHSQGSFNAPTFSGLVLKDSIDSLSSAEKLDLLQLCSDQCPIYKKTFQTVSSSYSEACNAFYDKCSNLESKS